MSSRPAQATVEILSQFKQANNAFTTFNLLTAWPTSNVLSDYISNSWTRSPTITQSNSKVLYNSGNWLKVIMRVKAKIVICIHHHKESHL